MLKFVKFGFLLLFAHVAFAQNEPITVRPSGIAAPETIRASRRRPASAFLVSDQPYSAEQLSDHVQTLIDGTHLTRHYSTTKLYRDSQGRIRIEKTGGPGLESISSMEILDPAAGIQFNLDIARRTVRRIAFLGSFSAITPTVGCPTDFSDFVVPDLHQLVTCEDLGTRTIEGLAAVGSRVTTLTPVGAIGNDKAIASVIEMWTSSDLKVVLLQKYSDPRTGEETLRLTNIAREEPDASLFRPPVGFKIMPPPLQEIDRR